VGFLLLMFLIVLAKAILWGVLYSLGYIGFSIFSGKAAGWINLIIFVGLGHGLGVLFSKFSKSIFYGGYALWFVLVAAAFLLVDVASYYLWLNDLQSSKGMSWFDTIRITNEYLMQKTNFGGILGYYALERDAETYFHDGLLFFISATIAHIFYVEGYKDPNAFCSIMKKKKTPNKAD
jgi:hypothetical protein